MSLRRQTLACLILALCAGRAAATEVAAFDVTIAGLRVAELVVTGQVEGERYAAAGQVRTTGLAAVLRRVRFAARAEGRTGPAGPRPLRYAESVDTGRRTSDAALAWEGGAVRDAATGAVAEPAGAEAVDPLTALFFGLRDVPQEALCRFAAVTFDGRRSAEARLGPVPGDPAACAGRFRRLAGYSEAEMAERQDFAFTLRYVPAPDGRWRVARIEAETLYGQAVLKRR